MGTDNLYHKRKERKAASLRRAKAKRSPYDVVLIVCEGAKTEPYYFRELKDALRLNSANIKICGEECGSDPLSVVGFAIDFFKGDPIYDRVYCVFDRDRHSSYQAALDRIGRARLKGGAKIIAVPSIPCFEFWLLIHYVYTTRQFDGAEGSICAKVIEQLRNYMPDYEKGTPGIFKATQDKLHTAIENAKRIVKFHETSGTNDPSTEVYKLIESLQELKNPLK